VIVNGFDINDYRYFRDRTTGRIYKFKNEELNRLLFKCRLSYMCFLKDLDVEYPKDKPFNLMEFIKMQKPITHNSDGYEDFHFRKDEYCLMTEWLEERIFCKNISINLLFVTSESIRAQNIEKLCHIDESEKLDINLIKNFNSLIPIELINSNQLKVSSLKKMYKFNRGISFRLPFKKGEKWVLSENIGLLFFMINQDFVKFLYDCEEILGNEKETIFYEQYKDNIPGTTIRYYKLKNDINLKTLAEIQNKLFYFFEFCEHNQNNYDSNDNIRYISIEYCDTEDDISRESEILKYATRLSQEDAIRKYNEDLEAEKLHQKELEALEYLKNHMSKYKKGLNRNMTPLEFMEKEQRKEREYLGKRLVKSLNKRIEDLNRH